jgi:hypothetical protein
MEAQCHANLLSLWQSKSHWDTFSSKYFNFHLSVSFHHSFTLIHSFITNTTGSSRNTWWFDNTDVSGTIGVGNLSLSALLARLKALQLPWSTGLYSFHGEDILKKQWYCRRESADISLALQYSSEQECP